jgi:hypothetical protein
VPEENNKSVVMEFYSNARFTETKYQSYVRGKVIDFSPDAINNLLGLIAPEECAVRQLEREAKNWGDSRWDKLLAQMCRPGATWKKARMLTYAEFLPIQTIESTSCSSEIPLKRVLTVSAILDQKPINVGELIADNIHKFAKGSKSVYGHEIMINWLCEKKPVQEFEGDLHTPTTKPITDKTMDVLMKKYEEYMKRRSGAPEAPPQQQPPQMERGEGSSQHGSYPPVHPMF